MYLNMQNTQKNLPARLVCAGVPRFCHLPAAARTNTAGLCFYVCSSRCVYTTKVDGLPARHIARLRPGRDGSCAPSLAWDETAGRLLLLLLRLLLQLVSAETHTGVQDVLCTPLLLLLLLLCSSTLHAS